MLNRRSPGKLRDILLSATMWRDARQRCRDAVESAAGSLGVMRGDLSVGSYEQADTSCDFLM